MKKEKLTQVASDPYAVFLMALGQLCHDHGITEFGFYCFHDENFRNTTSVSNGHPFAVISDAINLSLGGKQKF